MPVAGRRAAGAREAPAAAVPAAQVTLAAGSVRGQVQADGSMLFRAIPFAAPPTGANRWRRPPPPRYLSTNRCACCRRPGTSCAMPRPNTLGWPRGSAPPPTCWCCRRSVTAIRRCGTNRRRSVPSAGMAWTPTSSPAICRSATPPNAAGGDTW
ncbi:carboxylesterase family protein [Xanthomonas translucens pv. cerealis]|nr:carboxylesterase family protein [Xanthomonas translucens pv. cerealis]